MSVDPYKYAPQLWSETLLGVLPGQPPYLGCGVSTAAHGLDTATGGEYSLLGNGRRKGKAARTNDLKAGWRAFLKVADSNGIPDTDDYIRIHRAMAPAGVPQPSKLWTRSWDDIRDALNEGHFISIALRLSAVPGTALSRYTQADHQTGIWEPRLHWKDKSKRLVQNGKTRDIDPMHPHSDSYHGHTVDLPDVRKAAKAIEGGLILAWLYPIGGWTQEELVRQRKNTVIAQQREALTEANRTITRVEDARDRFRDDLAAEKLVTAGLRTALEECEASKPDDAIGDFIDRQIEWLEEQRP